MQAKDQPKTIPISAGEAARCIARFSGAQRLCSNIASGGSLKSIALAMALSGCLISLVLSQGAVAQTKIISPADLSWHPVTSLPPGVEIAIIDGPLNENRPFMYRLRYKAGWTVPSHSHPVPYHLTVISGTFNLGLGTKFDKSKTRPLKAGTVVLVPAGTDHYAWVGDNKTVVQIDAVGPWTTQWSDPKDDPANKKAN